MTTTDSTTLILQANHINVDEQTCEGLLEHFRCKLGETFICDDMIQYINHFRKRWLYLF